MVAKLYHYYSTKNELQSGVNTIALQSTYPGDLESYTQLLQVSKIKLQRTKEDSYWRSILDRYLI